MGDPIFDKIDQNPTIESKIVGQLREAIVGGKLALGERLIESDLADQMAVSRIPIREAFRLLEKDGLITRQINRGCFVISFSEKDISEVFSLRVTLEKMAIEWATPCLTAVDYSNLRQIIQRQKEAVHGEDYAALAKLDMQFHEVICSKANHSRLLKSWMEQQVQCQILLNLRFKTMSDYAPGTVISDHTKILQAMEQGDTQTAQSLTEEIGRRVSQECIKTLQMLEN